MLRQNLKLLPLICSGLWLAMAGVAHAQEDGGGWRVGVPRVRNAVVKRGAERRAETERWPGEESTEAAPAIQQQGYYGDGNERGVQHQSYLDAGNGQGTGSAPWLTQANGYTPSGPVIDPGGDWNAGEEWPADVVGPGEMVYDEPANGESRRWSDVFRLDTPLTTQMLDFQNRQSDKQLLLLQNSQEYADFPTVILGAQFRGSGIVGRTNEANKFSYLGRFPPDFVGKTVTDLRLLHANQSITGHVAPWATAYFETLFSDVFTFPAFNQGSFQVRQAYIVLGDLSVSPFYAFLGKKNVSFGDMGTLSPFSQSMVWHYFGPLAEGGGLGYAANGLHLTVTGLNGSRGIRVSDSEEKGHINNFAANGLWTVFSSREGEVSFGGGYLHGTIYDGSVAEHINPAITGPRNPAWDVNGAIRWGMMRFAAEYVETVNPWPVVGHKVQAYRTEMAWDGSRAGVPLWLSGSWSEGIQGTQTDEFEFNQQIVVGVRWNLSPHVQATAEYVRSIGFAPLINITTVSDKSVRQNSGVFGLVVVF